MAKPGHHDGQVHLEEGQRDRFKTIMLTDKINVKYSDLITCRSPTPAFPAQLV